MGQENVNRIRPSVWIFSLLGGAAVVAISLLILESGNGVQNEENLKSERSQLTDNTNQTSISSSFLNRVRQVGNSKQQRSIDREAPDINTIQNRLAKALNTNNQSIRHQSLAELGKDASMLGRISASELAEEISKHDAPHTQQNLSIFTNNYLTEKIKSDPDEAVIFAENLPKEARPYAYSVLVEKWSNSDVVSASEWASNIPDGTLRNAAISSIAEHLKVSPNLTYASEWARELSITGDGPKHAGVIAAIRSRTDPHGVFEWALGLPTPESRASAFGSFAEALVERDPVLAKEWIQKFPMEEGIREHGENKMAYKWMQSDPAAAINWSISETPHSPGVGTDE